MVQTINVSGTPGMFMPSIHYSQGDIGRQFIINVGDFEIPSGATVECVATKPSGFGFTVEGTVSDNTVTFTTTDVMTDEAGRFPAELRITSGGNVIGTANFYMWGELDPHPEGTIDGSEGSIVPELTLLVERVEAAASSVLDMEVEAQTLPAGSAATYTYNEEENKAIFGIPEGQAGSGAVGTVASAYSATKTYAVGDYVIQNGNLYRCTTAITTAESFTAAHWAQVVLADDVTDLKSDIGQWYISKELTNSSYLYFQVSDFGNRMYFKLIEPLENVSNLYVNASNDSWQTQTLLHTQRAVDSGYDYYVDVPSGYTSLRFTISLSQPYTGTYSAIIHTVDNHSISQNILDILENITDIEADVTNSTFVICDAMVGTNYNKFYLNTAPYQGISSINNTVFNLRKYAVEANKKYYLVGKSVSLLAELPLAAFGTEEVVAKNSYVEKILDGHTTGTDYFTSYVPNADGYIYVAWITNKAELQLYDSQLVSDAIDEILTDSANIKKDIKIQLFGDSITDNQWGDASTWANYISDMMPSYNVTIVNDAVGGSGIGHGKSTTTPSHQTEDYNYVYDLVTDGVTLQTDADAVVILVGTNNWASSFPLGDMSSSGCWTVYGALKGIVEYISQHSEAIVFICTIPQRYNSVDQSKPTNAYGEPLDNNGITLAEYCVPFEKVSAFYGMPCVHLNTALGWNRINITDFCGDGLHPNAKGDVMLAKYICSEIMKHI